MKISGSIPHYINQTYTGTANSAASQQHKKSQMSSEEIPSDSINLSERTKDMQKIAKTMETGNPEREQYVARIRQSVENNQYTVNAEAVAEKIIGSVVDGLI